MSKVDNLKENARTMRQQSIKPTGTFLKIVTVFLAETNEAFSGSDICKKASLRSGVVYPMLHDMEKKGWLVGEWENTPPEQRGRPQKKLYSITTAGSTSGKKLVTDEFPFLVPAFCAVSPA